jgi:PBP1b-binding outer membrane lipoprotein LpoB
MKKLFVIAIAAFAFTACNNGGKTETKVDDTTAQQTQTPPVEGTTTTPPAEGTTTTPPAEGTTTTPPAEGTTTTPPAGH